MRIATRLSFLSDIPFLGPKIRSGWRMWRYYRTLLGWYWNAFRAPGDAPLRPARLYRVSTHRITHRVQPEPFKPDDTGRVVGGDWDQHRTHLTNTDSLYEGLQDRYEHGTPWVETEFYKAQVDRIEQGESAWGCKTTDELRTRYDRLDDVYQSMQTDGYRSAQELGGGRTTAALDEICVHIARDGELLFAGEGNHRIRLAKLLELDEIAVRIVVRHEQWQTIRDSIANNETTLAELDLDPEHPDLNNL